MLLLSRRSLVLAGAFAGAWVALPLALPASVLALLARLGLAAAAAASAALVVAPALPRWRVAGLKHRAVFISGCDTGFGHKTALALDAAGAVVFAGCLCPDGDGAATLRRKASQRLRIVALDVMREDSVAEAAATVTQALREEDKLELWALVNNAGVIAWAEGEWMAMADLQRVFDVNVFGMVRLTQALLPLLRCSKGRVINVVSAAGRYPMSVLTPYTMSKYAAAAFSDCLRYEMDKFSISVHTIDPWINKTALMTNSREVIEKAWDKSSEHVKQTYGQAYVEQLMKFIGFLVKYTSEPSTRFVVDCMVDACLARDPQTRYIPGIMAKLYEHVGFMTYFMQIIAHKVFLRWKRTDQL